VAATDQTQIARPGRGRRNIRTSGDEREAAILQTAEELLQERPLGDIAIDDLARGAGISRSTFYFYFPSKDAVVLTLIDRMIEEAAFDREELLAEIAADPRTRVREGLQRFYEIFRARRAVVLAAAELRANNAEARAVWSQIMEGWVADVTAIVEAERERGAAPDGLPARDLAIALLQMNERVQHAAFAGEDPALAEGGVMDVLVEVWLRAIYGTPDPISVA
jgi:AcrR family transcriptional regulator